MGLIQIYSRTYILFTLVFIANATCIAFPTQAQQKSLSIEAGKLNPNTLPFPGQSITLNAEVSNTRDFRFPMRLLAVRDGKFYEVSIPSGLLGINDRPQYKVEIPAPIAELVYQFVLILPDGSAVSSKRVSIRRNCIPNIVTVLGELPDEINGSERFNLLLVDNKRLEQEIDNLEKAASEIDVLSELIAQ